MRTAACSPPRCFVVTRLLWMKRGRATRKKASRNVWVYAGKSTFGGVAWVCYVVFLMWSRERPKMALIVCVLWRYRARALRIFLDRHEPGHGRLRVDLMA